MHQVESQMKANVLMLVRLMFAATPFRSSIVGFIMCVSFQPDPATVIADGAWCVNFQSNGALRSLVPAVPHGSMARSKKFK